MYVTMKDVVINRWMIKDMVLYYTISLIFLYGINKLLQNLNIMYNININNKRGSVNEV